MSVTDLFNRYGFPKNPPNVPAVDHGWLSEDVMSMLAAVLQPGKTRIVVELGSWLGKSTRFIASSTPGVIVIAVDHWKGSREHQSMPDCLELLPVLHETFLKSCWQYRDRIIALRASTREGLEIVGANGIEPDIVYVDASHEYLDVLADVELTLKLFPNALLCGDDWKWDGVRRAVTEVVKSGRMKAWARGNVWWRDHDAFARLRAGAGMVL